MNLPDLLRKRGVDPDDFLRQARRGASPVSKILAAMDDFDPAMYVSAATSKAAPGTGEFWFHVGIEWANGTDLERWPELEAALGWLDPLEAELLEVKTEAPLSI